MIPILYEKTELSFASNGICRLRDCLSCVVTEERNGVFECDFDYPVTGSHYNEIVCGRIILVRHDVTQDTQPFDIVGYEKPINGVVTFHAVHISYRLNSVPFRTKQLGGPVQTAQNWLNYIWTAVGSDETNTGAVIRGPYKQFTLSTDIGSSAIVPALVEKDHFLTIRQALGGIEGSILDTFHGEYLFDRFSVSLLSARGKQRDFQVRYGLNMTEYNDNTDYSESANSYMAYWSKEGDTRYAADDNVLTPYNDRNDFALLDFTEQFETAPSTAQLESAAVSRLTSQKANLPSQTINVSFVDLHNNEEFQDYTELFECQLCDTITVKFPRYGMSGKYKIVKTVYNVLEDRYDSLELGSLSTSLSQALGISSVGSGSTGSGGGGGTGADYVTEQGTSGIWTYRKWNSGIMECWGRYTASIAITTASAGYGGYRSGSLNIPTLPITYTNTPTVTATSGTTGGFWVNNVTPSTTGGSFYLSSGASLTAANRTIMFHFIGK